MELQKKIVKIIALLMAIIGIALLLIGILSGPRWLIIILGGGLIISGYIAYASGMAYIDEQMDNSKEDKKLEDEHDDFT